MNIHLSLAAYPRHSAHHAMVRAVEERVSEPFLGRLSLAHVQVCPQNTGVMTEEYVQNLVDAFPGTQFRPHANVRVEYRRQVNDLDTFDPKSSWWLALKRCCEIMRAPAYSAHAGLRANATMSQVLDNTKRCEDFLGIPVGIEGHYPTPRDIYLVSSWAEYEQMLQSGVHFALDMSHLQIVGEQEGIYRLPLMEKLLRSEHCIEIHVSDNDGRRDSHQLMAMRPWWWGLLKQANPNAIIFSEGTQPDVRSA